MLSKFIQTIWYQKRLHFFALLLLPLSWLFRAIVFLRKMAYRLHILSTKQFTVPVIIIGNITVGGTGKTPVVIAVANYLKQLGYRPGIVSRGYGADNNQQPRIVSTTTPVHICGDEPWLIAKRTGLPVVICSKRARAVATLLEQFACDVVISDDGLQHYALSRTIECAVIDSGRGLGNGACLPAGPLREPKSRLQSIDFIISNHGPWPGAYELHLQYDELVNLKTQERWLIDAVGSQFSWYAVAGIGHPQNFFQQLRQFNFSMDCQAFQDHYPFSRRDFAHLTQQQAIIMTEKDAVKCQAFADQRFWMLPITAQLPADFWQALLARLPAVTTYT